MESVAISFTEAYQFATDQHTVGEYGFVLYVEIVRCCTQCVSISHLQHMPEPAGRAGLKEQKYPGMLSFRHELRRSRLQFFAGQSNNVSCLRSRQRRYGEQRRLASARLQRHPPSTSSFGPPLAHINLRSHVSYLAHDVITYEPTEDYQVFASSTITSHPAAHSMDSTHRDICIVGGGIIGVCTAYFIVSDPTHDPTRTTVTLVEEHEIAGAASGKAGGFLALDWHGPATQSLAALSYRLHRELAAEFDGESAWGYRAMDSVSITVTAKARGDIAGRKEPEPNTAVEMSALRELPGPRERVVDMRWLNPESRRNVCGTKETTAQV